MYLNILDSYRTSQRVEAFSLQYIHSCDYSNRNDALEHAKSLEGKWGMKHDNDHIVAKQCRVGSCGAKWKVKTWTRKDAAATVDYVLIACLTHDHVKRCKVAQPEV